MSTGGVSGRVSLEEASRLFAGTAASSRFATDRKLVGRCMFYLLARANAELLSDPTGAVAIAEYKIKRKFTSEPKSCSECGSRLTSVYWITNRLGITRVVSDLMIHVLLSGHPSHVSLSTLQEYHDFFEISRNLNCYALTPKRVVSCQYSKETVGELERLFGLHGGSKYVDPDPKKPGIKFFSMPVRWDFIGTQERVDKPCVYACSPQTEPEYVCNLLGGIRVNGLYEGCHRFEVCEIP